MNVIRLPLSLVVVALVVSGVLVAAPAIAAEEPERTAPGFRMASLNLKHTMSPTAVAHDVRSVLRRARPSVIGFQERRSTHRALRAALPRHWGLKMPGGRPSRSHNPIAFDKRVWKHHDSWPQALATTTWKRSSGRTAVDQYGVVAVLEHRTTGHRVRAVSFHMPPSIHDKRSGGPNWRLRDRVETFWRMAAKVRQLSRSTPRRTQFVALCDCNVHFGRDRTDHLVRGRLTGPLRLDSNYTGGRPRPGWQIDYVMAARTRAFRIVDGWSLHGLRTDHPAVVARFR
jgi:hypothetical protein